METITETQLRDISYVVDRMDDYLKRPGIMCDREYELYMHCQRTGKNFDDFFTGSKLFSLFERPATMSQPDSLENQFIL